MANYGAAGSGEVRERITSLLRDRQNSLASDLAETMAPAIPSMDRPAWLGCANLLLRLFTAAVDAGSVDAHSAIMRDLGRYCPPLSTRDLVDALHRAERVLLDEIALDDRLGTTSEPWALVAHTVRRATLEILGAHAEQLSGRGTPATVRDALTTVITQPVFELALTQEIERALRHHHSLALLLFDIDDLAQINASHGWGVGDRLLERTGILARRFFRTHDWVARFGDDSFAVLLPETTLNQAAILAARFREMVEQRLVMQDHKTDVSKTVTVSAVAIGTDLVQSQIGAATVLAEAEAAVLRAKLNGRNCIELVALLPTSLTILGAATVLGESPREVIRRLRDGRLTATRRGKHLHIDRDQLDAARKTGVSEAAKL